MEEQAHQPSVLNQISLKPSSPEPNQITFSFGPSLTMVSSSEAIAIAELCVYVPIFFLTLFVIFRHGFQRQLGWIYLVIFCIVRCVGAGFKIASEKNPSSTTDIEWAAILQSVGLSPLLMASLGLLKRVCDEVSNHVRGDQADSSFNAPSGGIIGRGHKILTSRATANSRRSRIIQILQIPTMIALILCVVGGIDESHTKASDISTGRKDTKIGVIIFLVVYLSLSILTIITMKDVGNALPGDKRIYFAVLAAIPFLAVRILWSILAAFSHNEDFDITGGKPVIQLVMAILEEFVIVCMYTLAGLIAGKPREY